MFNKGNISDQEQQDADVISVLQSLPRVSPPNDFEFRVAARIASGRPTEPARGLFGALKIAVPAAGLLAVGATAFILNPYWVDSTPVAQPAEFASVQKAPSDIARPASVPERSTQIPETTFASNETATVGARPAGVADNNPMAIRPRGPSIDETGGTSFVESGTQGVKILPRGIAPADNDKFPGTSAPKGSIAVREILSQIGLQTVSVLGGSRVVSVRPNSFGERSGVQAGDIIQAVNGRQIDADTTFSGTFIGKTLTVLRDGRIISLSLAR